MRIFIEWMAIFTPAMLKFFDCSITTTQIDVSPDISDAYLYRVEMDQQLSDKYNARTNTYFYNGDYRYYVENNEKDSDSSTSSDDEDAPARFKPFSQEFDNALRDILTIYHQFHKVAP